MANSFLLAKRKHLCKKVRKTFSCPYVIHVVFCSRVVEDFMSNSCYLGLVGDMALPTEVDTILRATAAKQKIPMDKMMLIGWVDMSKIGVLSQKDINKIGAWSEKLLSKNPTGWAA